MATQGKLRIPNRFITTHNDSGQAVIHQSIPAPAPFYDIAKGDVAFAQCYVTKEFPVKVQDERDIKAYSDFLEQPPGLTVSGGTVLRYVDMPPNTTSPMHRTISLDYGVVLEGQVELILDSGEVTPMTRGDIAVQRATMHAWKNTSDTEWARMLYILQPTESLNVGGTELKEDYGDMKGVKASD
jgi:quercetin dioxygenase-like cupin family protein